MEEEPGGPDYFSAQELRSWLSQETRNLTKEMHLRLQEATSMVAAYERGELTPEEATEKFHRYHHRWSPALVGHDAANYASDEELLAAIGEWRGEYSTMRQDEELSWERLKGRRRRETGPSTDPSR